MQVTAFNTPKDALWRWRIVNTAGDVVEESTEGFGSIHAAVTDGAKRLTAMNIVDHAEAVSWRRSTSYLRSTAPRLILPYARPKGSASGGS